ARPSQPLRPTRSKIPACRSSSRPALFNGPFPHGTVRDRMSPPFPECPMDVYTLLDRALRRFSHKEVALALGVDPKTVRRWQVRETEPKPYIADAIRQRLLPLGEPE